MTTRWIRAVRLASLALLLPASGCCTTFPWDAALRVRPERLIGARVDEAGRLELGVELNDGRRTTYRDLWVFPRRDALTTEEGVDPATIAWPCTPDEHGRIVLQPTPRVAKGAVDPRIQVQRCDVPRRAPGLPDVVLGMQDVAAVTLDTGGWNSSNSIPIPDEGDVRWSHPGSWLCVVVTPATAAIDLVTFPVQFVWVVFHLHLHS